MERKESVAQVNVPQSPDESWMQQALHQAERSVGVAAPNPAVGCVLVKDGAVVGAGFHEYTRKDHAEIVALNRARSAARESTAYVTLEPCCHTGRTGPCTDALIEAGVSRVVVATLDPNPRVHGKGVERLRAAGIEVETGVLERESRRLNDGFARHVRTGLPFSTLKAAVSLDGRIAPAPGTSPRGAPIYLTGEGSRIAVQQMRHSVDAVLTGINTVLQDDPLLTDRSGLPRRRPLLRVVLDSALRIPLDAKLVRSAQEDVLVFCTAAPTERQRTLELLGVHVERLEDTSPTGTPLDPALRRGIPLGRVLRRLGEMHVLSAMWEAGAQLNASALTGHHVDKLTLFYAPLFLGPGAVPLLQEPVSEFTFPEAPTVVCVEKDVRVDAYLRDPWRED